MDNPIIQALRRAKQAYMTNVGEPTAQLVGGGVRGYLGLDAPEYADSRGMEAYRNAAAISNTPVVGMPSMAVRAGAKAAPAIAQSLREHAKGFQEYNRALGPAGASQMVVWHGSPHKFDAFDASKIGTGEGAQAYGHGLYLAESPAVAANYRNVLSDTLEVKGAAQPLEKRAAQMALTFGDNTTEGALQWLSKFEGRGANHVSPAMTPELVKQVKQKFQDGTFSQGGALYKVDLPDEKIARMLDWDKPLSQQAQAKAALESIGKEISLPRMQDAEGMGFAYQHLANAVGGPKNAAALLRNEGIPGFRFLDAGSRGTGQGTSNFVVFPGEEAALTILERNNEIINALRKRKN